MISIIIPIYNVGEYLRKCLDSIKNQTNGDYECVLINDGSTDDSKSICEEYSKNDNHFVLYNKENGGLVSAVKYGILHSRGEYVAFVDGDDYVDINLINKLSQVTKNFEIDLCIYDFTKVYENSSDKLISTSIEPGFYSKTDIVKYFYEEQKFVPARWNKLFKREILVESCKSYNDKVFMGEDINLSSVSIANVNNFYYLKESLLYYRQTEQSMVHKYNNKILDSYIELNKTLKSNIPQFDSYISNVFFDNIKYLIQIIATSSIPNKKNEMIRVLDAEYVKTNIKDVELTNVKDKLIMYLIKHKMLGVLILLSKINNYKKK